VADIDSARRMRRCTQRHIRQGKGNRDRYVPLPEGTLQLLRDAGGVEHSSPSGAALSGAQPRGQVHVVRHAAEG
jgi:hypothetical protein